MGTFVNSVLGDNAVSFDTLLTFLTIVVTSTTGTGFNRKGSSPSKLKRSQKCLQAKDLGHLTIQLWRKLRAMGTWATFFSSVLLVRRNGMRRKALICRSASGCKVDVGWC